MNRLSISVALRLSISLRPIMLSSHCSPLCHVQVYLFELLGVLPPFDGRRSARDRLNSLSVNREHFEEGHAANSSHPHTEATSKTSKHNVINDWVVA